MGAFLSKKLTHNMGPFVRKFPCITYNGAFCSLKFCLYIFFFQTFSSFFFFFFLNFPGGGDGLRLPPLRVPMYQCTICVCWLKYIHMHILIKYIYFIHNISMKTSSSLRLNIESRDSHSSLMTTA